LLERKLNEERAKELTLGELMDLRDENPEVADRLNKVLDQELSDAGEIATGMGTFEEIAEGFEEDFDTDSN
jgi:hypothetical protein